MLLQQQSERADAHRQHTSRLVSGMSSTNNELQDAACFGGSPGTGSHSADGFVKG